MRLSKDKSSLAIDFDFSEKYKDRWGFCSKLLLFTGCVFADFFYHYYSAPESESAIVGVLFYNFFDSVIASITLSGYSIYKYFIDKKYESSVKLKILRKEKEF